MLNKMLQKYGQSIAVEHIEANRFDRSVVGVDVQNGENDKKEPDETVWDRKMG